MAGEVYIEIHDRSLVAILRDVARAVGFRFRINRDNVEGLVIEPLVSRDQLAAMAMQGILAAETEESHFESPEKLARAAYAQSDALLAEREKGRSS